MARKSDSQDLNSTWPNYIFCSHPTRAGCLCEILSSGRGDSYCCRPESERAASPFPPSLTPNPEDEQEAIRKQNKGREGKSRIQRTKFRENQK